MLTCTGSSDAWCEGIKAEVEALNSLVKGPPLKSITGTQGEWNYPHLRTLLLPTDALAWDSPLWEHVTSSNTQLPVADRASQKGLHSLFADLLATAPTSTPFVFHHVHRRPSVCGNDLKPHVAMCLRGKPCNPLTTGAIISFKPQDGQYESDYNVGKAVIYGRDFLRQLPKTLRRRVLVALTDFQNISLIFVTLGVDAQGAESLSTEMSQKLPNVKQTLLQLLSCAPQVGCGVAKPWSKHPSLRPSGFWSNKPCV